MTRDRFSSEWVHLPFISDVQWLKCAAAGGGGSAPPAVAWAQWLKWYARLWLAWSHGGGTFHSIPRGRIIHGATYFDNADQRSLV